MKNKVIAVWFSCGAASAVAAKLAVEKYGKDNTILIVNNPIKEEDKDNLRFKKDVEKWAGVQIIEAKNKYFTEASIVEVFEKKKYMSGVNGAVCTAALKKEARYQFEIKTHIDYHVLGFTFDELARHERFARFERPNTLPILIEEKITKQNCFDLIREAGITLPNAYKNYPNANCIGCVKSTSPTYWNKVRETHPEVFEERAKQSRKIGCRLVRRKGKRIFLDELLPTDRGGKMKSYECGIFCDTK